MALLSGDSFSLQLFILRLALAFFAFCVVACLVLILRRSIRNLQARQHEKRKAEFTEIVADIFVPILELDGFKRRRKFTPRVVSEVLLFYFRTLDARYAQDLRGFVKEQDLERVLQKGLRRGTLGDRTRSLQVLSYLETESSLECLREALHDGTVYVWLVAARGLARRTSFSHIPEIIHALEGNFTRKTRLIKTVLLAFGKEVVPHVERVLQSASDKMVVTACLETIAQLDADKSNVDPVLYLPDADDNVRAAALILMAEKDGTAVLRHINGDLSKETVRIRMRAAKLACKVRRPEFSVQLVELLEDSHFWVRYWAARAIHALGPNGREILSAMSVNRTPAGRMAGDVLLEMEAADV